MNKEITSGDIKIEKRKFHCRKNQILLHVLIKYWHLTRILLVTKIILYCLKR